MPPVAGRRPGREDAGRSRYDPMTFSGEKLTDPINSGAGLSRRSVLERVGPYSTDLGRTSDGRLLSCEDRDMFNRVMMIGARGFYRPDLSILHYVPPERLTKRYFRRWSFWHGVSLGVLDRRRPAAVPYLLGVPRYMIGLAVRATIDTARRFFAPKEPSRTFKNELAWWDLIGFFFGRNVYRSSPRLQ